MREPATRCVFTKRWGLQTGLAPGAPALCDYQVGGPAYDSPEGEQHDRRKVHPEQVSFVLHHAHVNDHGLYGRGALVNRPYPPGGRATSFDTISREPTDSGKKSVQPWLTPPVPAGCLLPDQDSAVLLDRNHQVSVVSVFPHDIWAT